MGIGDTVAGYPPHYGRDMPTERPDRNLALELVRTTEAAAMAGSRGVGRGDKNGADGAAVPRDAAGFRRGGAGAEGSGSACRRR